MTAENKNDVSTPCIDYLFWHETSLLPRSLMQGTRGMKAAGEKFLIRNPMETQEAYDKRLEQSTLLNAFRKTCSFLAGQVFQSDVIFADTVPAEVVTISTDIDGKGNSIHVFAKRIFMNGLGKGVAHILIDTPTTNGQTLTQEDEAALGIRAYFSEINPEDIIGYRFKDGKLEHIRIKEVVRIPEGEFGEKLVNQVRVYRDTGEWQKWQEGEDKAYTIVASGTLSYKGIPLVSFIPGEEWNVVSGESPLMDLAELNLRHWRSNSDQSNILHIARVPILFGRAVNLANIVVGPSVMITSDEEGAELKFVEITGNSIKAGADDLLAIEQKMALYGLQQLIPRTGNQTATEKAITSGESQSSLGTWAVEFESALQLAFEIAAEFKAEVFPENGVKVNKEYNFGIANDPELAMLLKANDQGVLSDEACFTEFKRRGIVNEHLTWEEVVEQLTSEKTTETTTTNLAGTLFGQ
jgi:Domain of unknown function (DUF4055)